MAEMTSYEADMLERTPRRRTQAAAIRTLVLAACLAAAGCGASEPASPADVAARLYRTLFEERVTGAPTRDQLRRLEPFLSDTLRALLAAADRMREADLRHYPDQKPSFAEGDLFSSLFEWPSSFRVAEEQPGEPYRVRMLFTYNFEGVSTSWFDDLVLIQERGRWVIDDIEYGGEWGFAAQGSLRSNLELAVR